MLSLYIDNIILRWDERKNNIKSKNYFYPKYLSKKMYFSLMLKVIGMWRNINIS